MAIIPLSTRMDLDTIKDDIDALLGYDRHMQSDIAVAERAVQEETLKMVEALSRLRPHTLPIAGTQGYGVPVAEVGACGIEVSFDHRVFVLFAARYPQGQLITPAAIHTDPAILQNFRERLPAFLKSYSEHYHGRLFELASEIKTLRDLGKVTVSYLKEEQIER